MAMTLLCGPSRVPRTLKTTSGARNFIPVLVFQSMLDPRQTVRGVPLAFAHSLLAVLGQAKADRCRAKGSWVGTVPEVLEITVNNRVLGPAASGSNNRLTRSKGGARVSSLLVCRSATQPVNGFKNPTPTCRPTTEDPRQASILVEATVLCPALSNQGGSMGDLTVPTTARRTTTSAPAPVGRTTGRVLFRPVGPVVCLRQQQVSLTSVRTGDQQVPGQMGDRSRTLMPVQPAALAHLLRSRMFAQARQAQHQALAPLRLRNGHLPLARQVLGI